ncbi:MAG TPA: NAD-dependent epimerase/dehydratase family protein [Acidimicrobiales bacterium]|nr:NAD-dependent epimerase/dehydratase family protein [Acidimicrobiales bacterium]
MRAVAVITPGTSLGHRVAERLDAEPDVDRVVVLPPDLPAAEVKARLQRDGADTVVMLEGSMPDVLAGAAAAAAGHVVHLSSATVYGAWPDNPVPLPEDAASRPNPGFAFAAAKAEEERQLAEWKDDHPGATAAVLRAAVTLGEDDADGLARALTGVTGLRSVESSRPVQVLAEDDLASALVLVAVQRLDGVFNVAPDGWVPDETVRALVGGPARLPVSERIARPLRALGRTWPGIEPYTRHPWVVANDRLRAAGWAPAHTNEEAFVDGAGRRWPELSPKRRQEVALAGTVVAAATVVATVAALVRRARRP